ncbi:MAG: tRNA uridine-5-carboxymethylaminomethyl(34) synthesis GTPase MnmE [Peptostreptococcaceae bacterium]|nr:tRNA uridine-5-carboxymethylaminomethyl(34) synthesis GTPase MnmE [Peptostreptococcaceae bacterium]
MFDETIAAISTAPGEAGIGIVRISGSKAIDILDDLFEPKRRESIREYGQRKLVYGFISDGKERIDEVLAVYMKGPGTYTAEDVAEIDCHGGLVPSRKILEMALKKGARAAERGEFTKRAFLNGRLDLAQAEAVMDLIGAKTDKSYDIALDQLEGGLSKKVRGIRNKLLSLLAQIEVGIDYPEEDIEDITYDEILKLEEAAEKEVRELLRTAETGKIMREGLQTVIIGKPNVGKSSLLNAMLQEARAIVTNIPGTTRDIIEEHLNIRGIPLRIVDTAGIRETEDMIEKMGVERSKAFFNKADLVILVLDAGEELRKEDREIMEYVKGKKAIVLINKTDLDVKIDEEEIKNMLGDKAIIRASVLNGSGLDELEDKIVEMVYSGELFQRVDTLVTSVRQKNALERALASILEAIGVTHEKIPYDFIEIDIKNAYAYLGEIIGETVGEDIIDKVFSEFCLGK